MLTHPGIAILPAALAAAEITGASGKELSHRASRPATKSWSAWPPSSSRPSCRAAFTPGRCSGFSAPRSPPPNCSASTPDQIHSAIAQCVNLAAGNLEGARSGGRSLREGGAVRNALLAVALAQAGTPAARRVLEGEAGFYHAYAGNNRGELRYSFTGANRADLAKITEGLGRDWIFLETLYRIYSTAGYNIAHVDVTAKLCEEHNLQYERHRPHRGGGQLARDRISEPSFPEPRHRQPAAGRQHAVLHRLGRGRRAAIRYCAAAARPRRNRSARGARPDAPRHPDPDGAPHAVRPAHHGLHQRRPQLHKRRHRPRIHLGLRRRSPPHPPHRPRPRNRRSAIRRTHRHLPPPRHASTRQPRD